MKTLIPNTTPSKRAQAFAGGDVESTGTSQSNPASNAAKYWQVDHSAYGEVTQEPLSKIALLAAENLLVASQTIPTVTHGDKANVDQLEAFRRSLKDEMLSLNVKLSSLAFFVKALAKALKQFPRFNSSLTPDFSSLVLKSYVHIGIAVDTDYGLVVPVIRNADKKGLVEIANEIIELSTAAREKKLKSSHFGGASITISSLGGISGTHFTPIVNPPEVAILGITKTVVEPVWNGEVFLPESKLPLDLTYDHRVINGAEAAKFLKYFCSLLDEPKRLMV
ncbi:dihydrolipoamide acetyltransferase [Marinomonas hwangdonensis]|uniref:Dihydrolipoyllysine-residue acetyltransferase component of pyruvate dehydrogenase complex n=1 Tax=Marinomonas hwangdonensis TaxID=1053647 RepID=A0A3M8PWB5_9GAMM|nr:2-oxo acid dehydrogenase subunit E2 [Marinomonas hwangdonensis]RNF48086.1 dihydrolipoamide acetyltransferase [Marinomonas hwangdonensis]